MALVQVIPLATYSTTAEEVAIANYASQVFPEESMWSPNNGDLVLGSTVPARAGSWISRFNLIDIDQPPLVQWVYDPESDNNASVTLENVASKAYLRICNIDIKPDPKPLFPDTHWEVNGLDLIPRGE
jgi:hypothetical protein